MDAHQQNMQTGLKNVRFDSDIFFDLKKRLWNLKQYRLVKNMITG